MDIDARDLRIATKDAINGGLCRGPVVYRYFVVDMGVWCGVGYRERYLFRFAVSFLGASSFVRTFDVCVCCCFAFTLGRACHLYQIVLCLNAREEKTKSGKLPMQAERHGRLTPAPQISPAQLFTFHQQLWRRRHLIPKIAGRTQNVDHRAAILHVKLRWAIQCLPLTLRLSQYVYSSMTSGKYFRRK